MRYVLLLPFRFDPDYVCASCGRRFALDEHDFAACAAAQDAGITGREFP